MIGTMSEPLNEQPSDDADLSQASEERPAPPAGSQITIERFADGLTIQIPPAGLWRGTKGLFALAVIWNGFFLLLTPCLLSAVLGDAGNKHADNAAWVLPLVLSVFWLAGIGILLASINMARRKAAIAVTSGTLMVIQTGIFGSKQRDWEPGDVGAVHVGASGMTVNDQPVLELQILDGGGSKFGLLAGRSDDELHWLASELRTALRVSGSLS
jgi:hypothetical protein